jgi:astacin
VQLDRAQKKVIKSGMDHIEDMTCIRFRKRKGESDFVEILPLRGCTSHLGRQGGKQTVSLTKGCVRLRTVVHELIHALGFTHMQNHVNRDKYVTINWENIQESHKHNFNKVNKKSYGSFGTGYDYLSIMHYRRKTFSKNKKETIVARFHAFKKIIGTIKEMSYGDRMRIMEMYQCE